MDPRYLKIKAETPNRVKENKLIWSGTTKSSNVEGNIDETAGFIIEEIAEQMRKDGSLPPKPKK